MEKQIILNKQLTQYYINTEGKLRNSKNNTWYVGAVNKGYKLYNLYFKGKQYTLYAHKLVAQYFIPNPNNYSIVHHIDGNKLNNNVCNLEWISTEEHSNIYGQAHVRPKILIEDNEFSIDEIASFRNTPYYATKDGQILNMSKKIKMRFEHTGKYYRVQCYYGLGGKHFSVHRIVWESFNGEIPKGYEIDHIDGNPHNNSLNNLQLTTHKNNCKKANHNNIKFYSQNINTQEIHHYSSLRDASCFRNSTKLRDIIDNHKVLNNCYWYYGE